MRKIQHKADIQYSELIIAANKDETAPVFHCAEYGITVDLFRIVPMMIKAIKESKKA